MASCPGVACSEAAADVNDDSSLAEGKQRAAPAMSAAGAPCTRYPEGAASMPSAKGDQRAGPAVPEADAAYTQRQAGTGLEGVREADHAGQRGQAAAAEAQHQAGGGVEHLREAEKRLNKVSWWLELTKGRVAAGKGSKADQQVRAPSSSAASHPDPLHSSSC